MRQGELLKDILEKEFVNENRGKLNACFHQLTHVNLFGHYPVQSRGM